MGLPNKRTLKRMFDNDHRMSLLIDMLYRSDILRIENNLLQINIENNWYNITQQNLGAAFGSLKESYEIPNHIGETVTQLSSWTVIPYNESVGNFKATVMVHDKVNNDIFSLQNTLTFDYTDPLNEVSQDNEIVQSTPVVLTLGIDANKRLYATLTGMHVTDAGRIHFCFERCILGTRAVEASAEMGMSVGMAAEGLLITELEAEMGMSVGMTGEGAALQIAEASGEMGMSVGMAGIGEAVAPPPENINYGLLYNNHAVTDARNIANVGWHVTTLAELEQLCVDAGGTKTYDSGITKYYDNCASNLKDSGTEFWRTGGNNSSGFTGKGAGRRDTLFNDLRDFGYVMVLDEYNSTRCWYWEMSYYSNRIILSLTDKYVGYSVRLVCDSGNPTTYQGNDGKVYPTYTVNGVTYTDNIIETKYRNGDLIPEVTDQTTWAGLTTGALCAYNNDWNNV